MRRRLVVVVGLVLFLSAAAVVLSPRFATVIAASPGAAQLLAGRHLLPDDMTGSRGARDSALASNVRIDLVGASADHRGVHLTVRVSPSAAVENADPPPQLSDQFGSRYALRSGSWDRASGENELTFEALTPLASITGARLTLVVEATTRTISLHDLQITRARWVLEITLLEQDSAGGSRDPRSLAFTPDAQPLGLRRDWRLGPRGCAAVRTRSA